MKLKEIIFDLILKIDEYLKRNAILLAIKNALTYMIPIILIGSMALVVLSLPIPIYQKTMTNLFGNNWKDILTYVRDGTFSILSILMVIFTSYSYVVEKKSNRKIQANPIIAVSVSLGSFIAFIGISRDNFDMSKFGVIGIFIAIIVSITATALFLKLSRINSLKIKIYTNGASMIFNDAIESIIPAMITILTFAFLNQTIVLILHNVNIQNNSSNLFLMLFAAIKSPLLRAIVFILMIQVLWFFGIHGSNVLEPVTQKLFMPLISDGVFVVNSNMSHEIFNKTFFDTFVLMGGCGTAFCLALAILIIGKHKNQKQLIKFSIIPLIFNINELIVFGLPIVLNPVYLIPFILVPLLMILTSYFAIIIGLVPYTTHFVEWTTPVLLSGYISTGSINGSILQIFNLILGTLCYAPFVKLSENIQNNHMINDYKDLVIEYNKYESTDSKTAFLSRQDRIGNIAKFLSVDLENALNNNDLKIYYQTQINYKNEIFGMEALLRWNHPDYGFIYPPLIISLADEANLCHILGNWVIEQSCSDLRILNSNGLTDIVMSVNIISEQLESNSFIPFLSRIMNVYNIKKQTLQIEITERLALENRKDILEKILSLKELGIKLAIDDFGMGHSSLMYLKEYDFDTVKIDGSLIKEILSNSNCSSIVSSIIRLGSSLNFSVLAEYVETEEQRNCLHELGCDNYQGYLYSPAITFDELLDYVKVSMII